MEAQVSEDMSAFSAPPPEVQAAQRKEREKKQKEAERLQKKVTPGQMKAAQDLTDQMKAEKEAEQKSALIQKLTDMVKLIKEYYPERAQFLKIPKTFGAKNSCEELRVWIADCRAELNKRGGLKIGRAHV